MFGANNITTIIFEFIVLIFSAILHEIAHGYEAERLGDSTARDAGRLTLNPLAHLDPFMSILLPLLLFIGTGGSFFFAAAKPVPYDPRNLKNPRTGSAKIAFAGPATNFLLAIGFGIAIRILAPIPGISAAFLSLLAAVVFVNILLGVFNLVPIPPLDGSRILFSALPQTKRTFHAAFVLERWGLFLVLIFVFFGFYLLTPIMGWLFTLFTGQPLVF